MAKSLTPTGGDPEPRVPAGRGTREDPAAPGAQPAPQISASGVTPRPTGPAADELPDLGERYRVLEELGRGGMGRVYVAHDLKLERDVAIKVLNPGAHGPEQLHRFDQEARAAASLDHPNVLAVHDIGSHGGSPYIVSELLRGQTFRRRLEGGPLPAHAALDFALQLAHGLAAAHERGIVHRDLKPDNIYLTSEGALKILDFGIAKLVNSIPDGATVLHTQSQAVMGTAEYMSPEQVRGASVDQRSDIFSFGVILYEMLTGRRPFQRGSMVETGYAILTDELGPLPDRAPPELRRIARRCLEKAPEKRYQSARELARELESHAAALAQAEQAARARDARRRLSGAVGLGVFLIAAAGLIWRGLPGRAPATTPVAHPPLSLLVADFKNETPDPVFEGTFEPILTVAMEGASFINAYKRHDARKIATQLKLDSTNLDEGTARLVAMREGIGAIVSGAIRSRGAGYALRVRAIEPREGKVLVERETEVADKAEVLPALGRLAALVRSALGDSTPEVGQLETFTSSSIEAAHEYALGQEKQHRGRAEEALVHYGKSLQLDANLGRAHAGMAVVSLNLHRRQEAEQYFQKALALIDRMTERERYRTRGTYYVFERDYEKAVDEYTALVTRFPADTVGFVNLAVAHCYRRDMPKALEAGTKALQLAPANVLNRSNLAVYSMYSSDFETASRLARDVVRASPTYLTPRIVTGLSELGSGHPERALEEYQGLPSLGKGGASMAAHAVADLALYQGRPHDAVAALERQIPADESDNPSAAATKLVMLASARLALGQTTPALKALDRAVRLSKTEAVMLPAARIYLDAGDEKKARAIAAELGARRAQEPQAYAKLIEGNAAVKRGDAAGGIRLLREAQRTFDTWIGRLDLGRAYLEAKAFAEAHEEFDTCLKRRGEATALFIDEVPTYRYLPATFYYLARAQEGLKSSAAPESYRAFLALKDKADFTDPLVSDARLGVKGR